MRALGQPEGWRRSGDSQLGDPRSLPCLGRWEPSQPCHQHRLPWVCPPLLGDSEPGTSTAASPRCGELGNQQHKEV